MGLNTQVKNHLVSLQTKLDVKTPLLPNHYHVLIRLNERAVESFKHKHIEHCFEYNTIPIVASKMSKFSMHDQTKIHKSHIVGYAKALEWLDDSLIKLTVVATGLYLDKIKDVNTAFTPIVHDRVNHRPVKYIVMDRD